MDISKLIDKAEEALRSCPVPRSGGWMLRHGPGSAYQGAKFDFDDASWAVCRGHQRPEYARLLDATVAYMKEAKATKGISILRPPPLEKRNRNSLKPKPAFLRRLQAATWMGCNVVWIAEGCESEVRPDEDHFDGGDLDETVRAMREALSPTPDLTGLTKSRDAEKWILPRLQTAMNDLGYTLTPKSGWRFAACWRLAVTDGVWERESGHPRTMALEVKLNEDTEAPLCQVVDDVSVFDAVVCVRVVTKAARDRLQLMPSSRTEAIGALQEKLPIRYLDIDASGMA
jgi:hypothetical protein